MDDINKSCGRRWYYQINFRGKYEVNYWWNGYSGITVISIKKC